MFEVNHGGSYSLQRFLVSSLSRFLETSLNPEDTVWGKRPKQNRHLAVERGKLLCARNPKRDDGCPGPVKSVAWAEVVRLPLVLRWIRAYRGTYPSGKQR